MTFKHLPGKHSQKLHASRSGYKYERDIEHIQSDYKDYAFESADGNFAKLASCVFDTYPTSYREQSHPTIRIKTDGFDSSIYPESRIDGFSLVVTLDRVTNSDSAEAFLRQIVPAAKQTDYTSLWLPTAVPVELAAELGAVTSFDNLDHINRTAEVALTRLSDKYGLRKPSRIDIINQLDIKRLSDYDLVSLNELLDLKHPLYPDVPMMVEYLSDLPGGFAINLADK